MSVSKHLRFMISAHAWCCRHHSQHNPLRNEDEETDMVLRNMVSTQWVFCRREQEAVSLGSVCVSEKHETSSKTPNIPVEKFV